MNREKKPLAFDNMDSPGALLDFLARKGMGHNPFYHYTALEKLQKMLESRKLHLTRMDRLNDAMECGAAPAWKKRIYVASFTFGRTESMAMWSMYGAPYHQAVRLTIPQRAITKTIRDFQKNPVVYFAENMSKTIATSGKATLKMMDVVYAYPRSLEYRKTKLLYSDFVVEAKHDPSLAFCVKNAIWLSENETRMVLELDKVLPGNVTKVAIDFAYAVDNLEITGGPCVCLSELEKSLPDFDTKKIHQSIAYDQVFFGACQCENCGQRTAFCRANRRNR